MKLNGQSAQIRTGETVLSLLEKLGHKPEHVAAELNGAIIPRENFAATILRETDTLEVVCFVGGG